MLHLLPPSIERAVNVGVDALSVFLQALLSGNRRALQSLAVVEIHISNAKMNRQGRQERQMFEILAKENFSKFPLRFLACLAV